MSVRYVSRPARILTLPTNCAAARASTPPAVRSTPSSRYAIERPPAAGSRGAARRPAAGSREQRPFGKTALRGGAIGFGGWGIGGDAYGATDDDESIRAIHRAL